MSGLRLLLVEDEAIIALLLERILKGLGISVLGPIGQLTEALDIARSQQFDGAILDVSVRGGQIYPVADLLLERGIPFVLTTGHSAEHLPANLRTQRLLRKPYSTEQFTAALECFERPPRVGP